MKILMLCMSLAIFGLSACEQFPQPAPATPSTGWGAAYPLPTRSVPKQGPRFTLRGPLREGDTVVAGAGPVGVPIRISDASLIVGETAQVLGKGVIDGKGQFAITVAVPLIKDHLVAIQLGDLTGTAFDANDFLSGDGYSDRPMVGIVFDVAVVAPK